MTSACCTGYCVIKYRVSIKSFPGYKHLSQENYVKYKHFFSSKRNSNQEVFFYNSLVDFNMQLLLHGGRLIDNQFLSTCSPTCLQLLQQKRLLFLPSDL